MVSRIAGHYTKSRSEMPGTCTDRRSSNARSSDQPSRARPNHGGAHRFNGVEIAGVGEKLDGGLAVLPVYDGLSQESFIVMPHIGSAL